MRETNSHLTKFYWHLASTHTPIAGYILCKRYEEREGKRLLDKYISGFPKYERRALV